MKITSEQRAADSAVSINRNVVTLKNVASQVTKLLAGASANSSQDLPAVSDAQVSTAVGADEVAKLQAVVTAINAL